MKKYILALSFLLLSVASFAQEEEKIYHATQEQIANAIRKSEYLKNPELVKTFERMFDHQEALGGVMLPGVKTSADVAREYVDKYMIEDLIVKGNTSISCDTLFTDEELTRMFDQALEESSEEVMTALIQLFLDWSVEKYGIKYPKIKITDEQVQANTKKITDGIYSLTKTKRPGHDDFEPLPKAIPSYIIVNKGMMYRMATNNEDYSNGTFEFNIDPIKLKVIDFDGTNIKSVYTWKNPTHERYAYKQQVTELLEPVSTEFGQVFYSMIGSMEGSKKKNTNRFNGAWKCVEGYKGNVYKVYGDDYRMVIQDYSTDSTFSMKGQYQICEYTQDGSTIEGGNTCKIEWINNNSYYLKYKAGSKEYTEKWVREPLPKEMTAFVKDCMSGKGNVKQLPTEPKELMAVLDAMPNCKERWNGYYKVMKMPESNTPEGWPLKVQALIQMSQMQKENGNMSEARKLAEQADELAEAHATDGTAQAMWYAAQVYINDESMLDFGDFEKDSETLEMALTCLDEFRRLSVEEPGKWKDELAQFDEKYMHVAENLTSAYAMSEQYKKCIFVGNKTLKMWEKTSEEFKNNTLYSRYNIQSCMLFSAQQTGNKQVLETCANDISAFLADVSEKFQKGEVTMDADTRETMMSFSTTLMQTYCLEGDLERSSEYAALAKTFRPESSSFIDYRYCMALADAGRYEEADRLHTELLNDEDFVKQYLADGDDVVAKKLEGHVQPKQKPTTSTQAQAVTPEQNAQTEQQQAQAKKKAETQKKINNQLANVNKELDKAQGANRVKIKGYTASSTNATQAKKDKNGRVALPVDSVKKAGVGIHFKF